MSQHDDRDQPLAEAPDPWARVKELEAQVAELQQVHRSLREELESERERRVAAQEGITRDYIPQLAECYRLTGADPDGNEDFRLAEHAVSEVKRLREEHDAAEHDRDTLRQQLEVATALLACKTAGIEPTSIPKVPDGPEPENPRDADGWPLVAINDHGIRPATPADECCYCRQKVGQRHGANCVIVNKIVKVRFSVELAVEVPHGWDTDVIEFRYNESTWCADNLADMIAEAKKELDTAGMCLCGVSHAEFVADIDPTPRRKLMTAEQMAATDAQRDIEAAKRSPEPTAPESVQ